MLKLMNKKQRTTTNKGFSLVELIVVIAIMAVLVAVLAPAMLRYVERSRKSTDASTISNLVSAAQTAVIEENLADGTYTLTVTGTGCTTAGPDKADLDSELLNSYNALTDIRLRSEWSDDGVIVTMVVGTDGQTSISYASPNVTGDDSFSSYTGLPETPTAP